MYDSTLKLHTAITTRTRQVRDHLEQGRERGSITVEHVMWAVVIVLLVGAVGAALTAWATGKVDGLG